MSDYLEEINDIEEVNEEEVVEFKESEDEEDVPVNEYMTEELAPIRANFKRINSTADWEEIAVVELQQSTEGGEVKYYYSDQGLEKIIRKDYGETTQRIVEYYLLNLELSFVFEKQLNYNRPIYWDSLQMAASGDTEAFDSDKSEVVEDRSYFTDGILLHQVSNMDCGAPFAQEYLQMEEARLLAAYEEVV